MALWRPFRGCWRTAAANPPGPSPRRCMGSFLSSGKMHGVWPREALRGSARGPLLAVETLSMDRPLSRPKPPEAVAEGQPLQASVQRQRSGPSRWAGYARLSRLIFRPSHARKDKAARSTASRAPSSRRTWACAPTLWGDFRLTTRLVSRVGWRLTMMSGARGAAMGSARRNREGNCAAGAKSSRHNLVFGGSCDPNP